MFFPTPIRPNPPTTHDQGNVAPRPLPAGVAVRRLNELVKGEISAAETYRRALKAFDAEPKALQRILRDHQDAVRTLRRLVEESGGVPAHSSGGWGVFARTVEGAAATLGERPALHALKEGERYGLSRYADLLVDDRFPAEWKETLRRDIVPKERAHVATLELLLDTEEEA